jgi:hypothetical protein
MRPTGNSRRISFLGACFLSFGVMSGSSAHAVPEGGGAFNGKGFDACTAPSASHMQAWWTNTPWSFVGIYIGGSARGCSQPNLTASWLNTTYAQGWRYELIWVGPQAPCTAFASRMSSNATTANQQGRNEAKAATTALQKLGFGAAAGTPVVYDLEGYPNNAACRAAVKAFMQGWVDELNGAPSQTAGVYGSSCNSYLNDFGTMARPPQFIVPAQWDNNPSTSALSCVSRGYFTKHQRIKQYRGDHNETWGGVTINIDSQCANGPLATKGGLNANSVCN